MLFMQLARAIVLALSAKLIKTRARSFDVVRSPIDGR